MEQANIVLQVRDLKTYFPSTIFPGFSIRRRMERDVTLFPQPDSPTTAKVSPSWREKLMGISHFRIITTHIIPNSMSQIIVNTTLNLGTGILSASSLSFLRIATTAIAISRVGKDSRISIMRDRTESITPP